MKPHIKSLDRVSIRRTLMYLSKKLRELYARQRGWGATNEWVQERTADELFWLVETKAIYDFDLAVDDNSAIVGVQPRPGDNWIFIELEVSVNECPTWV